MRGAFRHAFTGIDNQTADIGRILLALSFFTLVGLQAYAVMWTHQPFDVVSAAGAYGGLLASGCAALRIKAPVEPQPQ